MDFIYYIQTGATAVNNRHHFNVTISIEMFQYTF